MAARLLADENVPGAVVAALRQQGHDVAWIHEDAPGSPDPEVLERAQREGRVVVTFDKDFGELAFRRGLAASVGVVGELLSLQWRQVRFDLNEIHLRAEDTKARRARLLPMSQRLRALLDMRRLDPAGHEHKPGAYVFGDETGAQVKSVKTAWENCRLKAHGYKVRREKNGRLTAECREQLRRINLHFHDLRREAGSRFLEGGMPANVVQQFLDHAKLSTTSRYLKINRDGMHAALKSFERRRGDTKEDTQTADAVPSTQTADASKVLQ